MVIDLLWPSDTIWRHRSGSALAQVTACCLMAPSHYLNQCWLSMGHSPKTPNPKNQFIKWVWKMHFYNHVHLLPYLSRANALNLQSLVRWLPRYYCFTFALNSPYWSQTNLHHDQLPYNVCDRAQMCDHIAELLVTLATWWAFGGYPWCRQQPSPRNCTSFRRMTTCPLYENWVIDISVWEIFYWLSWKGLIHKLHVTGGRLSTVTFWSIKLLKWLKTFSHGTSFHSVSISEWHIVENIFIWTQRRS